ncbi:MAG: glycosyltransferase family 2 protein [Lachnospiraceae bacterium]|jgi:dolichol-phosphate mannosyltransferase|nr:glycosyltransferase family 2 protein [Lachnospiraceae bacterium]MBQ3967760.1 glycosyltransferase family 2 protein [Lachnospiraceae bacterium]
MMKVSIVISVFNEEAVLDKFYEAFENFKSSLKWDYELIFVNDGSRDKSLLMLSEFAKADDRIKVISFSRNFGHEAAMIAGVDNATGDGIVCMDADLQHPLESIPQIIEKFEEGYDVISMVRTKNKSAGLIKNITSKLFYKLINKLADQAEFEENASDFFAITSRVAKVLRENYREKIRFLRGYVQLVGFKKATIEYAAADRAGGKSHYSIRKLMKFSISTIILFSDLPLKLGIHAGILSGSMGLITLIYTLLTYKAAPSGYATIVILICFLFAVLFLVIGIIGEYISVLFAELKDRPIYIIEEMINYDDKEKVLTDKEIG